MCVNGTRLVVRAWTRGVDHSPGGEYNLEVLVEHRVDHLRVLHILEETVKLGGLSLDA